MPSKNVAVSGRRSTKSTRGTLTKAALLKDEADVVVTPIPIETTTTTAENLIALGLPNKCVGGAILGIKQLGDDTGWVVVSLMGVVFGIAFELGKTKAPWAKGSEVDLTILGTADTYELGAPFTSAESLN